MFVPRDINTEVEANHIPPEYFERDSTDDIDIRGIVSCTRPNKVCILYQMNAIDTIAELEEVLAEDLEVLEKVGFIFPSLSYRIVHVAFENRMSKEEYKTLLRGPEVSELVEFVTDPRVGWRIWHDYHKDKFLDFMKGSRLEGKVEWYYYYYDGRHLLLSVDEWDSLVAPPEFDAYYEFLKQEKGIK